MQVQGEMLVVLMVVLLSPSANEGRVVDECQLRDQLNQTLNANLLDRINMIVCHANLASNYSTSLVKQIPAPRERWYGRHRRSLRPEHMNQNSKFESKDSDSPKPEPKSSAKPKPEFNSSHPHNESHEHDYKPPFPTGNATVVNQTSHHNDDDHGHHPPGRKPRSPKDKAKPESKPEKKPETKPEKKPETNPETKPSAKPKPEFNSSHPHNESHEHDFKPPLPTGNTTVVNQTAHHNDDDHGHHPPGRKPRSPKDKAKPESKPEKKPETKPTKMPETKPSAKPKPEFNSSHPHNESHEHDFKPPFPNGNATVVNQTSHHNDDDHGHHPPGRKPRSPKDKTKPETKPEKKPETKPTKMPETKPSAKPKPEFNSSHPHNESHEHDFKPPFPTGNNTVVNQTSHHNDDDHGHHPPGRKPRSPKEKTKPETKHEKKPETKPSAKPKPEFNSSHPHNESQEDESSSEEKRGGPQWTLYGVFQLADRVACVSGTKPSLNLCGLTCDKLIDDDITDDIACVGTIINEMLSGSKRHRESYELIRKMYNLINQRECANGQGPFSTGC